jgi:hypothetical protein
MNEDGVFTSKVSKWIAGLYWSTLVFLVIMFIGIPLLSPMPLIEKLIFILVFSFVILVIAFTLYRAYRLRFITSVDRIIIHGLWKKHEIEFSDIADIKKIPIPFGFRLFGASLLGGWYYFPGVGKAIVAMSNFNDGVLISTKQGRHFVITPSNPMEFIDSIKKYLK